MNRSTAQKKRHLRQKDPTALCWRCSKKSVEVIDSVKGQPMYGKKGVCLQHSEAGQFAAAKRAAVVKAAPELLAACQAVLVNHPLARLRVEKAVREATTIELKHGHDGSPV